MNEEEKKLTDPSLWDTIIATQQTSNYGLRWGAYAWQQLNPLSTENPDDRYDTSQLKNTKYESYAWALSGVNNLEASRRLEQIQSDEQNMQVLHSAPWYKELAASLTLPFTDPTMWASAALGTRVASVARMGLVAAAAPTVAAAATGLVVSGLTFGAAHWAIGNLTKQKTSDVLPESTWQQMMVDSTLGIALEFGIGKFFSRFGKKQALADISREDGRQLAMRMEGKEPTLKDLKRQYVEGGMQFYEENPGTLNSLLNRFSHGVLGGASYHNRIIARGGLEAQRALAEMKVLDRNTAMNKAGYASQVSLEARIARSVSGYVGTFEEEFAKGFEKSSIRSRNDFSREMHRAMLSNGEHSDAGVASASKAILSKISKPTEEALFNLGVTDTLKPHGENTYIPIVYDPSKILDSKGKVTDKFFDFMSTYLKEEQQKKLNNLELDKAALAQSEETLLAAMTEWEMGRGSISTLSSVLTERREAVSAYQAQRKELVAATRDARRKVREKREELKSIRAKLNEAEVNISEGAPDIDITGSELQRARGSYAQSLNLYKETKAKLIAAKENVQHDARMSVDAVKKEYKALKEEREKTKASLKNLKGEELENARDKLYQQDSDLTVLRDRIERGIDYESSVLLGLLEEDIPNKQELFAKLDERLAGHKKQVADLRVRLRRERTALRTSIEEARIAKAPELKAAKGALEEEQAIFAQAEAERLSRRAELSERIKSEREAIRGTRGELKALRGRSRLGSKELTQLRRDFVAANRKYNESFAYSEMGDIDSIVGKIASNIVNGDVEMGAITLPISSTSRYRFRRKIKVPQLALVDFTNNDFYSVYKNYINKAAGDIEIAKQYGPSLKFRGSDAHKRLLEERSELIKKNPKLTPWIMVQYEKNIRDLENILLRLGGNVPGKYKEAGDKWWGYAAKLQRGITAATALSLNSIQVMNELSTLLFAGGLRTALNTIKPSSWGFGKLARDELRSMRLGLHMAKTAVAKRTLRDLLHDYKANPVKEMIAAPIRSLSTAVQYANLSKALDFIRVRGTLGVIKSNLGFTAYRAFKGKVAKRKLEFARALGLSDAETKEIGRLINEHGRVTRGYFGIDKWENQELASKVVDAMNVCMIKRNTAITKVDLPFIYDHPLMASLLQFTSWIPAFANKVVIPGILDHQGALAFAAIGYVATDYMTRNLKYQILGIDKDQETIIMEAAKQNPFLGWLTEAGTRAGNIYTGLTQNNYAQVARGISPAAGQAQDIARMVHGLSTAVFDPNVRMSNADYNAFMNSIPGHNLPGLAIIFKKRTRKKKVVTQYSSSGKSHGYKKR